MDQSHKIAQLNDAFRTTGIGGDIVMTHGVATLSEGTRNAVVEKVRDYDDFSDEGNDPYGEHDFGSIEVIGTTYFWKIDYLDKRKEFKSEDPADPEKTCRILTIMMSAEY